MFKFHPPTPERPLFITITYIDEVGDNMHEFVAHQDFIDTNLEYIFEEQRIDHYVWDIRWKGERIWFHTWATEEEFDPFKDNTQAEQTFSIKKTPQRVESLIACLKDWDAYYTRYHHVP